MVAVPGLLTMLPVIFGSPGAALPALAGMLSGLIILQAGRRVGVGCDAVMIANAFSLSRKRVAIAELDRVEAVGKDAIRLVRKNGPDVVLNLGSSRLLERGRLESIRDLVVARAQLALAQHHAAAGALAARLAQGTQSVAAWADELRKLRSRNGDYRNLSLRDDDLWAVVENPAAPEDARGAAAVLLERDPAARARLRVAAAGRDLPPAARRYLATTPSRGRAHLTRSSNSTRSASSSR